MPGIRRQDMHMGLLGVMRIVVLAPSIFHHPSEAPRSSCHTRCRGTGCGSSGSSPAIALLCQLLIHGQSFSMFPWFTGFLKLGKSPRAYLVCLYPSSITLNFASSTRRSFAASDTPCQSFNRTHSSKYLFRIRLLSCVLLLEFGFR